MNPGSCRDRRVPSFQDEIDPEIRPMSQDSLSLGFEHQLNRDSVLTVHYIHNDLRDTIEDIGFLNAQGDEGYLIATRAAARRRCSSRPAPRRRDSPRLWPSASTTRSNSASAGGWPTAGSSRPTTR